jgi:hypothetical protein
MEYKGYKIEEVFTFTNGKSDFQLYEIDADYGVLRPSTTLATIKEEIDLKREEDFTDEFGHFDESAYNIAARDWRNKELTNV